MKKRNASQTKELILNTAIKEFAKYGFDGLRVDELAQQAGVNKATIYYHFKDKSFLFEKILMDFAQDVLSEVSKKQDSSLDVEKRLEAFLDVIIYVVSTKREIGQIFMQELSYGHRNISEDVKKEFFRVISILVGIVNEGIEKKVFKKVNPFLIHSILVGSINYYFSIKNITDDKREEFLITSEQDDDVYEIKKMILGHILA